MCAHLLRRNEAAKGPGCARPSPHLSLSSHRIPSVPGPILSLPAPTDPTSPPTAAPAAPKAPRRRRSHSPPLRLTGIDASHSPRDRRSGGAGMCGCIQVGPRCRSRSGGVTGGERRAALCILPWRLLLRLRRCFAVFRGALNSAHCSALCAGRMAVVTERGCRRRWVERGSPKQPPFPPHPPPPPNATAPPIGCEAPNLSQLFPGAADAAVPIALRDAAPREVRGCDPTPWEVRGWGVGGRGGGLGRDVLLNAVIRRNAAPASESSAASDATCLELIRTHTARSDCWC